MSLMCATGSCQTSDRIWGIINPITNRLHRLTFSKSLADFICATNPEYQVARFAYSIGRVLERGEVSSTGIYGIMSASKHYALRASLIKGTAELYTEDSSRYLRELHLLRVS